MNWYLAALKKYAVFSGRARRKEYWLFALVNLIVSCVLTGIDFAAGTMNTTYYVGLFEGIYSLAVIIPGIAVSVRRLHDTGRSGWWLLIAAFPCLGGLVLFYFLVLDGTPGDNRFGPNPKAMPA
jgi:uncharacterized membrane protein YhaH (DUF805 family)